MTNGYKVRCLRTICKTLGTHIKEVNNDNFKNIRYSDIEEAFGNKDRLLMIYRLKINYVNKMLGRTSSYSQEAIDMLQYLGCKNIRKWIKSIDKLKLT